MKAVLRMLALMMLCFPATLQAQENSLLWQISGKGLKEPSYLFGTIHLICKSDYLWTPAMERSLSDCKATCFEIDLDDMNSILESVTDMMDSGGKALSSYFNESDYSELKTFMRDSLGMDLNALSNLKPSALESMVSMKVTDCDDATSYEQNIMKAAHDKKMSVLGLETPAEQFELLDNIAIDTVVKELLNDVNGFARNKADYRKMVQIYRSQNLAALRDLIVESGSLGTNSVVFLDNRNKKWIPKMERMMKKERVFFAVGAGHLAGNNGLIELLKKQGYKVSPKK